MATFPLVGGYINCTVKSGDFTYFGGSFTSIKDSVYPAGSSGFQGLARFTTSTGIVDQTWKPLANTVMGFVVSSDGTKIYAATLSGIRKYNSNSATAATFIANANGCGFRSILMDGNYIYLAGTIGNSTANLTPYTGGIAQTPVSRPVVAKIDVTGDSGRGTIDATFVCPANASYGGNVNCMAQDTDSIWIGGNFTQFNNTTNHGRFVKINKSNGQVASDWPTAAGTQTNAGTVDSIIVGSNGSVYLAGSFFSYALTTKPGIAKISKQGALDTNFASPISNSVSTVGGAISPLAPTRVLEVDGALYLGGAVSRTTNYATFPGKGILKSSGLSTFALDASFDITTGYSQTGTAGTYGYTSLLSHDGTNLFLGVQLQGAADVPYYKSVQGQVWTIDKSTAAVIQLGGVPVDTTPPTVTLTSSSVSSGGRSSAAYQDFTATSSELAVNFQVGDIVVTNGTVSNFLVIGASGGTQRTFRVTPTGYESAPSGVAVTVSIPAGAFTDSAGNQNTASNLFSYTNDQIRPTVNMFDGTGAQLDSESVRTEKQQVSVSFTESVTGFDVSDISVSGATISDFAISSPTAATFSLKNLAAGAVTFSIAEGRLTDLAGNINYSRVVSFTKLPALEIASQSVASGDSVGLNLGLVNAASFQIVEEDAYFCTPNNWRLLIMYFKSTDGRKVLIGANSDQDFAKNFSSVAPPGTQFLLRKMIIRGENGSMLVIPRASIAGADQIDITLT